jgi:hypothetical protein
MSTIVTRAGKGSPLTHNEVDANFTNLNTDKVEKTSADITGGTIDNTSIGATTPSTVNATTITGQTGVLNGTGQNLLLWGNDFSNAVWAGSVSNVTRTANTIDFINASSFCYQAVSPAAAGLTYTFSVTLSSSNKTAIAIRISGSSTGTGGQSLITLTSTPTRYSVTVVIPSGNSAAFVGFENRVGIGGDGSLGLVTVSNAQFEIGSTANTYIPTTTTAVYGTPTLSFSGVSSIGLLSNGALYLQPAGTGALQAQATTSTTAGGNARGANAVDWQTSRGGASQVASGGSSTISGGVNNTANTFASAVSGGAGNTAGGSTGQSFVGGGQSNTGGAATVGWAAVVGGKSNTAAGFYNIIGGGFTNSGTSSSAVTTQSGTMNGTTAVTLSGSNANIKVGQFISGTSIANDTYVAAISGTSLTLSQNASGSSTSTLSFFTPHGVVVGGGNNQATGSYSFIGGGGDAGTAANRNVASGDWSVVSGGQANTASGSGSVVGGGGAGTASGIGISGNNASGTVSTISGGMGNTATAVASTVGGGRNNAANSNYSFVTGFAGTARSIVGNNVSCPAQNPISGSQGHTQIALLILAKQTTDATPTALCSTTAAAGTTNQVILPNNSAYFFRGEVISGVTGGGDTKGWTIEGVIKRGANAASTALVGIPTVTSTYADLGAATWDIAVTADTTNGGIRVTFTGQAATTIRTVCQIRTTEMTF